jgi:DNA-binding XRE family transcriptional regulator
VRANENEVVSLKLGGILSDILILGEAMSPSNNKARKPEEKDYLKLLGVYVRKWREQKGFTQEQLAPIVGFTRSYITEIETGKRNISFLNLLKILEVLEIDDREFGKLLQDINN